LIHKAEQNILKIQEMKGKQLSEGEFKLLAKECYKAKTISRGPRKVEPSNADIRLA